MSEKTDQQAKNSTPTPPIERKLNFGQQNFGIQNFGMQAFGIQNFGQARGGSKHPLPQQEQQQQDPTQSQVQAPPLQKKENKTGLPNNLKEGVERLSGIPLDDVKVYRNSPQPANFQAHAFAKGTDIHLAPGQEKHLPHEAWHVVQQKQGRVKPTIQWKGELNLNDDPQLEKEADLMGEKAMQMPSLNTHSPQKPSQRLKPVMQRASTSQVLSCIGKAESPSANAKRAIAEELAEKTGGKPVSLLGKIINTTKVKDQVLKAATGLGYSEDSANRLVDKNPFNKEDIKPNSKVIAEEGTVTSFEEAFTSQPTSNRHLLYFSNTYKNSRWSMKDNFRNPYLANFFASDVVQEQKELIESTEGASEVGDLKVLARANIVSESGVKWAQERKIKDGDLSAEDLAAFLLTENGAHSKKIADNQGVEIVSATASGLDESSFIRYKFFTIELMCKPIQA